MTRPLLAEIALSLRVLLRMPGFWIPTILFPAMLYAFFGAQTSVTLWALNAMASFAIYAVLGVGFFQFGVGVAQDRESPFALWQTTLPGARTDAWIARILSSLLFTTLSVLLVILIARFMAGLTPSGAALLRLMGACLVSAITATVMGIALGSVASARAAVPLANLIYLPLAYLGGLWVPPPAMPATIEAISRWTPTRAMGELGWAAIHGNSWPLRYVLVLAGWTLIALAVAGFAQARNRKALFG